MIYIAYFVLAFTSLQLLVSFANLLFRERLRKGQIKNNPLVSVLIPARNEEENIGNILKDLLVQDYGNIEIVVFNDQSDDKTASIVLEYAKLDKRINLINSAGLPQGWLGKNFACHNLSQSAKGDYFLFLDADVRTSEGIISNSLVFIERYDLALMSIFPRQIISSFGEKITVPNMNYILLSLLPLVLVRKLSFPSMAAANGQFMMFNSKIYKSIYPHELMKGNKVEDIEIARFLKKKKFRIACLTGDKTIMCRMYPGLREAVNGFSKNVTAFFGNSLLVSLIFWITTTFGFIPVLSAMPAIVFTIYISAYLTTRIFISVTSEQNLIMNLLLFIPQQISCGLFIYKAFTNRLLKDYQWKGRSIK
jgi:glycosyltransferase involved in cell wall biosynthesis